MHAGLASAALPVLAKTVLPAFDVDALSGLGIAAIKKAVGSGLYIKKCGKVCCVKHRVATCISVRVVGLMGCT